MKPHRLLAAFAAAVVLAAPLAAAPPPNPYSERLAKLEPLRRHAVFRRAILDAGERCKTVDAARLQGRFKNLVMWTARCPVGGEYGVFIGPDGSVQVRQCRQMAELKLPACRSPA